MYYLTVLSRKVSFPLHIRYLDNPSSILHKFNFLTEIHYTFNEDDKVNNPLIPIGTGLLTRNEFVNSQILCVIFLKVDYIKFTQLHVYRIVAGKGIRNTVSVKRNKI